MGVGTRSRVLRREESFLIQMDDFERFLARRLRSMLDPVVAAPPPPRARRPDRVPKPVLAAERVVTAPLSVAAIPILDE